MEEAFPGRREALERIFVRNYGRIGYQLNKIFKTNPQMAMTLLRLEEPNLAHALWLTRRYEYWDLVGHILDGLRHPMQMGTRWTEW